MFRNRNQLLRFSPEDGMQVTLRGKISLFEGRGEFQLIVDQLEEAGEGALRRAFDALKLKLQTEGLFDESRKRRLPTLPGHVGIITSPTGAAIHDILTVLKRRFPAIAISILPVQVQGENSVAQITDQIEFANRYRDKPFDVLLLARGGGSLEDMLSFNTEHVARAITASKLPIVCAVGHESDFSIADFAADLRAPTPSAAAELISPDVKDWHQKIESIRQRLAGQFATLLTRENSSLTHLSRRLRHPESRLQHFHQQLDRLEQDLSRNLQQRLGNFAVEDTARRLHAVMQQHLEQSGSRLRVGAASLANPLPGIQQSHQKTVLFQEQLNHAMTTAMDSRAGKLSTLGQKLHALSPLGTLERGYAIVRDQSDRVVTEAKTVANSQLLKVLLQQGQLTVEVKETHD